MSLTYTNFHIVLRKLPLPIRITSQPYPYTICATKILIEILKREMLQYQLTFTSEPNSDIFIDHNYDGVMVKPHERVPLIDKNTVTKMLVLEGDVPNGPKKSCYLMYEMAKYLNFLPNTVTWPFAVCSGEINSFEKKLYIPYLNHSTLKQSLSNHAPERKVRLALTMIGISLFQADLPFDHISHAIRERSLPLLTQFKRPRSGILSKDNMCLIKEIGSRFISREEHLFTILHYLSVKKPFDAIFCLENLDFAGSKVYHCVCEISKRVKVRRIFNCRVGFMKWEKEEDCVIKMVGEMIGVVGVFCRMGSGYKVVSRNRVWEIKKSEVESCIKAMIEK